MKIKQKTLICMPLFILIMVLSVIAGVLCIGITTASAATSVITTQIFTGTEESYHDYYLGSNDYGESLTFNTGIKFYPADGSTGTSTNTNTVSMDVNSFYIDFTNATKLYVPSLANQYMDQGYYFYIKDSANKVVYSACYYGSYILDANWMYCDYEKNTYINGKLLNTSTSMIADLLHFTPKDFGKQLVNLSDGEYKIEISRDYMWSYSDSYDWHYCTYEYYESRSSITGKLIISQSAPSVEITGTSGGTITSGSSTNQRVTFTAGGDFFSKLYYKTPTSSSYSSTTAKTYTIGTTNGWYYAYAEDIFGKASTPVSIYYDGTGPVGTLYAGTTVKASGAYVNSNYIKYTATDANSSMANYYVKMPGSTSYSSYTSGTQLVDEGTYYFYSTDTVGNQSAVVSITLDKTIPVGTLYAGTTVKASGSYVNTSYIKYTATDAYGIANCYVKLPGASSYTSYTSGTQLTTEGAYSFYSVDRAGNNSATVTITLDRTAPVGTLYGGTTSKLNGAYVNSSYIKYTAIDSISGMGNYYVKMPGSTSYINYTSGSQLTDEGLYYFYSVDNAGNQSAVVSITLDKTIPVGTLYAGSTVKASGAFANSSYVKYTATDSSGITSYYVKLPGASSYTSYTSGAQLTAEGIYYFYSIDKAGNQSAIVSITLDRTVPVGAITSNGITITTGAVVSKSFSYSATDSGSGVATLYYKTPVNSSYQAYTAGSIIATSSGDGYYYFYAVDKSGNQSATVSVYLDTTKPILTMIGSKGSGIANGGYTNEIVTVSASDTNFYRIYYKTPSASSYSYTTSSSYTFGTANGQYCVYAEDVAGNCSDVYSFYYDTVKPVGNVVCKEQNIANGGYVANSFSYVANDTGSGVANLFYKSPTSNEYKAYYSGMLIPVDLGDGWYYFYSIDNAGNQSEITSVFLETQIPYVEIYRNDELAFSKAMTVSGTHETDIYLNPNDELKITCETSSGYVLSNYTLNVSNVIGSIYTDSTYTINITSATGISGNFVYHIVHHKPTIMISGETYYSGSLLYFNSDTTITFVDDSVITNSGNTGAVITSEGNVLLNEQIPYATANNVTLTTAIGTDTKYILTLNDRAGNESYFIIFVDKLPPVGVWETNENALLNNGYTNKPLSFIITEEGVTATYSCNGGEYAPYSSGQMFTADGTYNVILTDRANNRSTFTAHIDTIPPLGQIYADNNPVDDGIITNQSIFFSWDGDISATVNGKPYSKNSVLTEDSVYHFVLTDFAGNYTEYTAVIDTVIPTYNQEKLNNSQQFISKWYVVTVGGQNYSFATYEEALTFACDYEFNEYVTTLILNSVDDFTQHHLVADGSEIHTGEYWLYKSKLNPDSILYYFDRAVLDDVVAYYANNTVSDAKYFSIEKDNIYGTAADSMVDNVFCAPDGTMAPVLNGFVFYKVDGSELYAELVGGSGSRIKLEYGIPFDEQVVEGGLYKLIELDEAQNVNEYYGYFDVLPPELNVSVTIIGNTEPTGLTINPSKLMGGVAFYYESFNVNAIIDSDKWSVLAIENNGKTSYYTYGAELPCLNVGGEYVVSVYDRLGQGYSFTVYIIGNPASIFVKNNSDDTAINLTISLEQKFDTLVSLEIRRNGELLEGVTTNKLSYMFEKAGTYTVSLRDNFGRVITMEYIFVKALPEGVLEGVTDGSKTKTDVMFTFDSSKYYATVIKDGKFFAEDISGEIYFEATDVNSGYYTIRLIRISDTENFVDYSFIINTIAPDFSLTVADSATTNKNVTVTWSDTDIVSVTYSINGDAAVELGNGAVLSAEGTYIIIATNDLEIQSSKTFTIDKTLEYNVLVNDAESIGVEATNQNVTVVNLEPLSVDVTKDGDKINFKFGQVLTEEGCYSFKVYDEYGNTASFTVIIDKSVSYAANIGDGIITNDGVSIVNGEALTATVTRNNLVIDYQFGEILSDEGAYRIILKDTYGNSKTIQFQIVNGVKRVIDYTLGEDVVILNVEHNGENFDFDGNRLNFVIDGEYVITAQSEGEEYTFTLALDSTPPTIELHGVSNGGSAGKGITIDNLSEEANVVVYKDGEIITYELGDSLDEYGEYRVVVTDLVGNVNEYNFTLKYKMDGGIIALIVVVALAATGVGIFLFIKKRKRS